jgi:hypothetical protein
MHGSELANIFQNFKNNFFNTKLKADIYIIRKPNCSSNKHEMKNILLCGVDFGKNV